MDAKLRASSTQLNHTAIEHIRAVRGKAWRVNSGMVMAEYGGKKRPIRFGQKGMEDVQGYVPVVVNFGSMTYIPSFIAVETKRYGDKIKDEQLARLSEVLADCGLAWVLRDETVDGYIKMLHCATRGAWGSAYKMCLANYAAEEQRRKDTLERAMTRAAAKQKRLYEQRR